MDNKIAVLGAGAIGSSVGADLTGVGHDVLLIDQWPGHVDAMKQNGLRVVLPDAELNVPVRACHLCDVCALKEQFDVVLFSPKSYDTRWMAEFIECYLGPQGVLVGLQNGMNDEAISSIVGRARTVGCVLELSAELIGPGAVHRKTPPRKTWFALGELDGNITPRLGELEKIMSHSGTVSLTTNIRGAKWTKLINSTMILAPFGLLGLQSSEATDIPAVMDLCVKTGRETMAVGQALGYAIEPIFGMSAAEFSASGDELLKKLVLTLVGHIGKNSRNTLLQDHLKGRRTEVDYLNGLVVEKGRGAHVPTPYNEAIARVSRQIEIGVLKPDISNLALIEESVRVSFYRMRASRGPFFQPDAINMRRGAT